MLLDIADSLERKDLREKVLKYAGNYTLDGCGLWWCDLFSPSLIMICDIF